MQKVSFSYATCFMDYVPTVMFTDSDKHRITDFKTLRQFTVNTKPMLAVSQPVGMGCVANI